MPTSKLHAEVMQKAQVFWAGKVIFNLADRTKRSERAVKYWKAGEREMDLDAFLRLCGDDKHGAAFVDAFMRSIPQKTREEWFAKFRDALQRHTRRQMMKQLQREEAEDVRQEQDEFDFSDVVAMGVSVGMED